MVFNATFNNNSAISWCSVLLVEETWVPGENHRPATYTNNIYHITLYSVIFAWAGFELTMFVVICIDCIGSYKLLYGHDHDGLSESFTVPAHDLVNHDAISVEMTMDMLHLP